MLRTLNMPNDTIQSGTGNFSFKNIFDSEFNIFIGKSYQYQDLLYHLEREEKLLSRIPKDEKEEYYKINEKVNDLRNQIEEFKRDVLQLAEQFNRININTERLKCAKAFFDKGEFGEARAVLEMELEQMQAEQEYLLREKEYFENKILPSLKDNSEEFLILALTAKTDSSNPNRFETVVNYFERSIKSNADNFNIVEYILFLEENHQYEKAERLRQATKIFDKGTFDEAQIVFELQKLSGNYYWSWNPDCIRIWREIDPVLWERCEGNPRLFLKRINRLRLLEKATDSDYVERLQRFSKEFEEYLSQPPTSFNKITAESPIAYFCTEYGIHNSLPNYSGGLGILAGDYLKSASDMNVPLVAVGLFYRFGFFRQRLAHNGWQEEYYLDSFENELPLLPVLNENGERLLIMAHMRGREVLAQAWLAQIGKISLYLLDTNVPQNTEIDRLTTGHLYGGDTETRILQEMILGIGGVRLLRGLGLNPSVYHLNEGHSAFVTLELVCNFLQSDPNATFADAVQKVREQCVFTIHTPVASSNDIFPPELLEKCFDEKFIRALKLSKEEFFALGRTNPVDDAEWFGMTPLAIRMTRSANGISRKHGEVSQKLWQNMFPKYSNPEEVPIKYVTAGVHPSTWIAPTFQTLYKKHMGSYWKQILRNQHAWHEAIEKIPDEEIWQAHQLEKKLLLSYIHNKTLQNTDIDDKTPPLNTDWEHFKNLRSRDQEQIEHRFRTSFTLPDLSEKEIFDEHILTIGFAHRVATHKRWNLLMFDSERWLKLINDTEKPVQFVFAGKVHPQDRNAKALLQNLMNQKQNGTWLERAVFIEDYDHAVAHYLVHGVDVWMNLSRRPLEASGTGGQKAAMNGVLNLSVLDGWWIEGYDGFNGFSIGNLENDSNFSDEEIDSKDAKSLFQVLENEVIPSFYTLDKNDIPTQWIARMRRVIQTITPYFSSDRMLKDYLEKIYP